MDVGRFTGISSRQTRHSLQDELNDAKEIESSDDEEVAPISTDEKNESSNNSEIKNPFENLKKVTYSRKNSDPAAKLMHEILNQVQDQINKKESLKILIHHFLISFQEENKTILQILNRKNLFLNCLKRHKPNFDCDLFVQGIYFYVNRRDWFGNQIGVGHEPCLSITRIYSFLFFADENKVTKEFLINQFKSRNKLIDKMSEEFVMKYKLVNDTQFVKVFLNLGIDINVKNSSGNTPLMEAIIQKDYESTCLLLKAGMSISISNLKGENVESLAKVAGEKFEELILQYRKKMDCSWQQPPSLVIHNYV